MMNIIHFLRNRNALAWDATLEKCGNLFAAFRSAELWSGMAAATVVLPQTMASGVALLIPLGFELSAGAIVGLIGVAALSFVSGIAVRTRGLISAPTGTVLALDRQAFDSLVEADNSATIALFITLCKAQGNNSRLSAMEINRLDQW